MIINEKTEQKIAPNNTIVPEKEPPSNSITLTQSSPETPEAAKIWSGRVSLDDRQYQNKPQKGDVGRINNAIANGATDIDEERLIEAITSGQSWSPTIFEGGSRKRKGFVEMWALVADFDDGFKDLAEIQNRAVEHDLKFSFVHESFSHTPERPKYRGIFLLSEPVTDYQEAKFYCEYIKDVFQGMVDKGAAEPTRLYYGGRAESKVRHNRNHQYSLKELERKSFDFKLGYLLGTVEPQTSQPTNKETKSAQKNNNQTKSTKATKQSQDRGTFDYQIDEESFSQEELEFLQKLLACLDLVSPDDCDHHDSWFEITCALKYEALEHGTLRKEIKKIWDRWSSQSDSYNLEDNDSRWASLSDTSERAITLGTVIQKYCGGWDRVRKHIEKLFPNSESERFEPYLVSSRIGTFQSCLARVLESQGYISLSGKCYEWTGTHWTMVNDEAMMTHIARESEKFYRLDDSEKRYYPFATKHNVTEGLNFFKSLHSHSDINMSNAHLIAFDNGTLDIRTNVLSPGHNQDDYLIYKIVGDYVEGAELPEVAREFFSSAFGEELIPYLRAVYKMYLDPTFPYGKFVHVIGPSGSGKGTFIRLLLSMLSPVSVGSGNDLTCFNQPDKVMQELSGKSIYALPDMSGFTSNCTGFYELVDNGILSGRNLYASHTITKRWNVRFIVGSVTPLKVGGSSDGWARRVLQLPTKPREGKPDIYLEQKLKDVSAQIASWALQMPKAEALELIQNAGTNEIIRESTLEAAIFGDPVKQFLDQCVLLTGRSTDYVPISKLYEYYKLYCKHKGYKAVAQNSFSSTVTSDLGHLRKERTTVKGDKIPARLTYIKMPSGLFPEASIYSSAEYNSEHESEDNLNKLLKFDPELVDSNPDRAEIETAIMFGDESTLLSIEKRGHPGIMVFKKILREIDESKLNEAQRELLAKFRK